MSGKIHCLKTWPEHFSAVLSGAKTYEVRKNDRGFGVGDVLVLQEWIPESQEYTREMVSRRVSHILHGGQFGIADGYVVMGIMELGGSN